MYKGNLFEGFILNSEYKILEILGQGNLSNTYLAKSIVSSDKVIIEEFFPHNIGAYRCDDYSVSVEPDENKPLYEKALKNFLEEKHFMVKMNHLNIVSILQVMEKYNTAYIVMTYEEGETLDEYLSSTSFISEDELLSIMMPILEGVKYLHSKEILHMDIALDNIYLRKHGTSMLIGLGAAKYKNLLDSTTIAHIIKDGYSPPERYLGNIDNKASDIYALGAVMYYMITGHKPTGASKRQMKLLAGERDKVKNLVINYKDKYNIHLLNAIVISLDFQQKNRFQVIEEFQHAIIQGLPKINEKWWKFWK